MNDIHEFDVDSIESARIIALLIIVENNHPGYLKHVLRTAALALGDWRLTSSASDPKESLRLQQELDSFLNGTQCRGTPINH
jgi:hypothetical protein